MFSITICFDLECLKESASKRNQVKELKLQEKLGKQNFPQVMKKVFELVIDTVTDFSKEVTETMLVTSVKSCKSTTDLNDKPLDVMNERGESATFMPSFSSKLTSTEHSSQIKVVKFLIQIRSMLF